MPTPTSAVTQHNIDTAVLPTITGRKDYNTGTPLFVVTHFDADTMYNPKKFRFRETEQALKILPARPPPPSPSPTLGPAFGPSL
jgi:hypothetical protein